MLKRFSLFFCLLCTLVSADNFPLADLYQFGDALNIEGARIPHEHLNDSQLWSNICVVLDRPFLDGAEWQEITEANSYPLKESSLSDYNEPAVNLTYVTILNYYITHAHKLLGKSSQNHVTILVQVHRNSSGPKQLDLLERLITTCFSNLNGVKSNGAFKNECFRYYYPEQHVTVRFCYGVDNTAFIKNDVYRESDIVLSYSLVAGFNRSWKSGSLLLPTQWTPFFLKKLCIVSNLSYCCRNHLIEVLDDLLLTQNEELINCINTNFCSPNISKGHKAEYLMPEDFKVANLLQVDGMFNPSQLPTHFTVE